MKGIKAAYDQVFHHGVNIIRSYGNSVGKSTIMDFIFYILGGDIEEWNDDALTCHSIIAEFALCEKIFTFKREINKDHRFPPLYVFEGSYDKAINDSLSWLKFSHKRTEQSESFSKIIFRLLHFPETKSEANSTVTINELLRLIYCDQLTAVDQIFKKQSFDSSEMRQTVGEFLLGVDDLELHELRRMKKEVEKEIDNINGKLSASENILKNWGLSNDVTEIQKQVHNYEGQYKTIKAKINQLESDTNLQNLNQESDSVKKIREEILDKKNEISRYFEEKEYLTYNIEDSLDFITAIEERIIAIKESRITMEALGTLTFQYCPSCLSRVDLEKNSNEEACHLCKSKHDDENQLNGVLRAQIELENQLDESKKLLTIKNNKKQKIENNLLKLESELRLLQDRLASFDNSSNEISGVLKDSYIQIGSIGKTVENLHEKRSIAFQITLLRQAKKDAENSKKDIDEEIKSKEKMREERWDYLNNKISDYMIDILQQDFHSEDTFEDASFFEFNFARNKMFVDGRSKFSASSMSYLRSAFFLSLFLLSLEDKEIRYPRFVLFDNIEDKGMIVPRVQNMHNLIFSLVKDKKCPHQLIFTTACLADNLDDSEYCVGPKYSKNHKTLDLS